MLQVVLKMVLSDAPRKSKDVFYNHYVAARPDSDTTDKMLGIRVNEVNSQDIRNSRIEEEENIESTTEAARDLIVEIIDDEDYDKQDIKRSKRSNDRK